MHMNIKWDCSGLDELTSLYNDTLKGFYSRQTCKKRLKERGVKLACLIITQARTD